MNTVKTTSGEEVRIGRKLLATLASQTDKGIRDLGYEPQSVWAACDKITGVTTAELKKASQL